MARHRDAMDVYMAQMHKTFTDVYNWGSSCTKGTYWAAFLSCTNGQV